MVVLVTAWAAGLQTSSTPPRGTDAVRLGPQAGEPVAAYVARTRAAPGDPRAARTALVQLDAPLSAGDAAAAVAVPGVTTTAAVFRVPLPRVQTAQRRITVSPGPTSPASPASPASLAGAEARAASEAAAAVRDAPPGRLADVARYEAAALGRGCACMLAVVVRLAPGPDPLPVLAARPGARVVEVAPPSAGPDPRLALSPLLPEQGDGRPDGPVVGPVPDDGPVPVL